MAAAAAVNEVRRKRRDARTRGIGGSKPGSSSDESDWEDASDDGGFSDGAESALAYGSAVSHAIQPSSSRIPYMAAAGVAGAALGAGAASMSGHRPSESLPATNTRKSSVVDPALFGPVNSLRGMINTPCGFDEDGKGGADPHHFNKLRRAETEPIYKGPMRDIYAGPTSDPNRFDARDIPYRSRPAPVPLQQPKPMTPVSSKVYNAERFEEEGLKHSRTRSDDTGLGQGVKLTGIAAAAAAAAALASDRKSKRESRREERRKDRQEPDFRDSERDKDRRSSKRDSYSSKYADEGDHKRSARQDDTPRKRRETDVDHYPEPEPSRKFKRSDGDRRDSKSEVSRSSRRDSRQKDDRDERRDHREDKAGHDKAVDKHDPAVSKTPIDPFQFQVADGALATSLVAAATLPGRPLTPQVVTVDREPNFDDHAPNLAQFDSRLSRKDSFEIEKMVEDYHRNGGRDGQRSSDPRPGHDYEERQHEAMNIYEETKNSTAPIAAVAMASAVAVEMGRSRGRRHDEYSDDGSRDRKTPRDPVQEDADRYYREMVVAHRIAADEERSRSQTPDRSILNKYEKEDPEESYNIVTPPEMEENKATESRYAGPDADVKIDNKIYPKELHMFRSLERGINPRSFTSRDPSCERDRPVLNLVYPTPESSRHPTPSPQEQRDDAVVDVKDRSINDRDSKDAGKDKKSKKKKKKSSGGDDYSTFDVVIGPEGDIAQPTASTVSSKSVTWGENSTKRFEVESPEPGSRSESEATRTQPDPSEKGDKSRPQISATSQWGILAAAIAGSSSEPANEPEPEPEESRKSKKKSKKNKKSDSESSVRDISAAEPDHSFADDGRSAPPVPGQKPASPTTTGKMPGGFADDLEFAATLAAGLKDTGFDPNIVIDDPAYRRRDSPPHNSESNGDAWNHGSFSDVVTNLTSKQKGVSEPGFFSGDVDVSKDEPSTPTDEWAEVPKKLSKKEKKKLEKLAKRQSLSESLDDKDGAFDTELRSREAPEADDKEWAEASSKKAKKSKKRLDSLDDSSSKVSVPADAFDDLKSLRKVEPDDEWDTAKKSKKKSKRDSSGSDILSRGVAASELAEEGSSKSSTKSKRRGGADFDDDGPDPPDPDKSRDTFDDRDVASTVSEDRGEDRKKERRSKRSSLHDDDDAKSVASAPDISSRKGSDVDKSERHRSGTDFDDYRPASPENKHDLFEDRDVTSVVSESRGDERRKERRSKRSSLYDDDDAKSVASAPGSSRKSKRSSLYDDDDAKSTVSASGSTRDKKDSEKSEKRSSGIFASLFKSGTKDESKKDKENDSFLDNAGTLGVGAGLATAAAVIAASATRSNADRTPSPEQDREAVDRSLDTQALETFDPEIAPRAIKPAIDPQYGDLLPLPPSEPGSPKTAPEDLPSLPDSRPDTPPEERNLKRDHFTHRRRRSTQDTPVKSPSRTAIPISLRLGQRGPGTPTSPGSYRSPPSGSPVTVTTPESITRRQVRHTSWDSSREIKPLYLLEHSRQNSADNVPLAKELPALPPSEPSSRESPRREADDAHIVGDVIDRGISAKNLAGSGLHIDTTLVDVAPGHDFAGSQESTPKAASQAKFTTVGAEGGMGVDCAAAEGEPIAVDSMSKDRSSYLLNSTPSSTKSNKTARTEGSVPSPHSTAPSKMLGVQLSLSDIAEDLTSADEHFSDAVSRASEDNFEEAQDWSFSDKHPEEASYSEQMVTVPQDTGASFEPETIAPGTEEEPEPEEWKFMSAKEQKRAKKNRKNKALDLAAAAVASTAAAAVAASVLSQEPTKGELPSDPVAEKGDFEEPQKGKKGKKNKKKSFAWDDDWAEKDIVQPPAGIDISAAAVETTEFVAQKDHPSTVESEAWSEKRDIDTPMAADLEKPIASATIEDSWEVPSKKSKKKRKSKDTLAWDERTAEPPAELESAVDTSRDLSEDVTSASITDATPISEFQGIEGEREATRLLADGPAAVDADDFWSPTSSKKDKKKKKKSLQLEDSWPAEPAPAAVSAPVPEQPATETVSDVPAFTDTASAQQTGTADDAEVAVEEDFAAAVTGKKKKKKEKRKSVQWEVSVPDPAEATTLRDLDVNQDLQQPPKLDSFASEPLFSQGDPALETTQDTATSVEATQAEDAGEPPARELPTAAEAPEDFWTVTTSSKKKDKKSKKKSKTNIWDLLDEQAADAKVPAEQASDSTKILHVDQPIEDPSLEATAEPPRDVAQDETTAALEDAQPEDEWGLPSKKSKKKMKGSKSASFSEEPPTQDLESGPSETVPFTDEPKPLSEAPPTRELQSSPGETVPFTDAPALIEDPSAVDATVQADAAIEEGYPVATGRKGKKKSRSSLLLETAQGEVSVSELLTQEPPEDIVEATADPEDEFEVPKKGKKNKKKKNMLPWADLDTETKLDSDAKLEGSTNVPLVNENALDLPTYEATPDDQAIVTEATATEQREIGEAQPAEAPPADDADFLFPVKLSKKDKKKRNKKQAALEELVTETGPEPAVDTQAEETVADSSTSAKEREALDHTPTAEPQPEPEVDAEDEWGGFSLKPSKKDRKKKKKQATLEEFATETKPDVPAEIQAKEELVSDDKTLDGLAGSVKEPQMPDEAPIAERPSEDKTFDELSSPSKEPSVPDDTSIAELQPEQPAEANVEDEWSRFNLKQSKKDKKKKKKQAALEEFQIETDPSSTTTIQIHDEPPSEKTVDEPSASFQESQVPDDAPVAYTQPETEANAEDEWSGFNVKQSKKDKKKNKKAWPREPEMRDAPEPTLPTDPTEVLAEASLLKDTSPYDTSSAPIDEVGVWTVQEATPQDDLLTRELGTEPAKVEGDEDEWAFGLSKKEKKKAKALETAQGVSSITPEETTVTEETEQKSREALADDAFWTGTMPKKDKKKNKKAKKGSSYDDSDPLDTAITAEKIDNSETRELAIDNVKSDVQDTTMVGEHTPAELAEAVGEVMPSVQDSFAQPSGESKDQSSEDEWDRLISGKKGNNDKKSRKTQEVSLPWDEPRADVPENTITADRDVVGETEDTTDLLASVTEDVDMPDTVAVENQSTNASLEDSWSAIPMKLSKKDKKKKKRQSGMPDDDLVEEAKESRTPEESVLEASTADEVASTSEQPVAADEFTAEPDSWFPTKKSKKDKKKAAKLALATAALTASEATHTDPLESTQEERTESPAPVDPFQYQGSSSWADEMEEEAPIVPFEPVFTKESEAVPTADAEDTWAVPSKKKGKKGKKSKSSSGTMTPANETAAAEPPLGFAAATNLETSHEARPLEVEAVVNSEPASATEPVAISQPAEDDWGFTVKKKGKKGKKSKPIPLADFEEPSQPFLESEPAEFNQPESLPPDDRIETKELDLAAAEPDIGKTVDFIADTLPTANEDLSGVQQVASADATPDDEWAVPSTKKAKKEKKRKSSQAVILDFAQTEPMVEEELAPSAATQGDEATEDHLHDDFSMPKSKKKKKGKKDTESLAEALDNGSTSERSASKPDAVDDVWGAETGHTESRELAIDDTFEDIKAEKGSDPSNAEELATAGAVAGGVAMLAEKFGGGKKKKAKGKQKKIVDRRQSQDDDMFDDPALWEGADKKALEDGKDAELHEDFWGGDAEKDDFTRSSEATEALRALPVSVGGGSTKPHTEWKETAYQAALMDDEEFTESPVLGREESAFTITGPKGLLRRGSGAAEPVGGLLRETADAEPMMRGPSPEPDSRWSPTRSLPAVEEVPEEAEAAAAKYNWPTPEMNRDSGFAADSPNPQRRRSIPFHDEQQRDSGVHTSDREWPEGHAHAHAHATPDASPEQKLRRSPFATPVLREPAVAEATPEPEKRGSKKKPGKGYGELAAAIGGAAGAAGAAGIGAAARSAATASSDAGPGRRSVSDNTGHKPGTGTDASPLSPSPSGRAEPVARRSVSNTSLSRHRTPEPLRLEPHKMRPDSPGIIRSTPTPPLRRVDRRMSGDLRALRQQGSSTPTQLQSQLSQSSQTSQQLPPTANESRVRSKDADRDRDRDRDMADVYDGFGEGRMGSPRSPTRPHSMRRRQSMQVLELESRVDQLVAENRLLTEARTHAEQNLSHRAVSTLSERDAEIESLKHSLQFLQNEVARLTEVNAGLTSANAELANKDSARYADLEVGQGQMSRGLDGVAVVTDPTYSQSLQDKDAEIADLRAQLEAAKEQIRQMQRQILESKAGDSDFLDLKDEDYFDNRCQQLCSHVQQWVLRFSKFSDMRACRLASEINDEKTIDRLDNAVLDGSDVDTYLRDRVKRRDIFMSMTMNMIWEFIFTRYLFGMDREQRQKLKSLEKLLTEVGPAQAVRQWRAVTLTLLSRRDNFRDQRELDTEAVVQAVFQTLCKILPPPSNLEGQIQSQLRRVMNEAVDLAIEMRTQRAEYMMLPPLQPEYDADGELAATVNFDAAMMNERSGHVSSTNEELEEEQAVVRVLLFPLVVKRGDDSGVGEDKIVVCPAQVLVVRDDKNRRQVTPSSELGGASLGAHSRVSLVPESMGQPEAEYIEGGI